MLVKKLCSGAPVSETLSNECHYKCPKCGDILKGWVNLRSHCARSHQSKVSCVDLETLIVRATCYVCKICSKTTLCDRDFFGRHLAKHKMRMSQYVQDEQDKLKEKNEVAYSDKVIGNLCFYRCDICKDVFTSKFNFSQHCKTIEFCKKSQISTKIANEVYHKCKICQKAFLCLLSVLKPHFKKVHKLSVEDYCNKTGCVLDTKSCDGISIKNSSAENPFTLNNGDVLQDDNSILKASNRTRFLYVSMQVKKLCQGAVASERVGNQCWFQCMECGKQKQGWSILNDHMKMTHSKNIFLTQVSKLITKAVRHKCKVCSEKMLCDDIFIRRHLASHKISKSQYIKNYCINTGKIVTNSDNVIGNLCVFQCDDCKKRFDNWALFKSHKKRTSHCRNIKPKESLIKKVCHKCKLCNKQVNCDKKWLYGHFLSCHGISMEEYCKKTGCSMARAENDISVSKSYLQSLELSNNLNKTCVFTCDICSKVFYTSVAFKQHFKLHRPKKLKAYSTYITKGFSYQCRKCSKLMLCDKRLIRNHMYEAHNLIWKDTGNLPFMQIDQYKIVCDLFKRSTPVSSVTWETKILPIEQIPISEVTSKIGNLCSFQCPRCNSKEYSSWIDLVNHCKKVHDFVVSYSYSFVSVARCHSCLLCPKAILSDRTFLCAHLQYMHKITLTKYEQIYRQNGGDVLPTFPDWLRNGYNLDS